jgi:alkanesulfonate monooxygenase SsuD/methylene tetrahydromethanopterin reductase-like flavin-dependent oxidoreductase (luciferase family)
MPFAAASAEAMFLPGKPVRTTSSIPQLLTNIPGMDTSSVLKTVQSVRQLASEIGREPNSIRFIVGMLVIVDKTDEKARAKYEEYLSYADLDVSLALSGGWTGADLGACNDDQDLAFDGPGGIISVVSSWKATIPGTDGVKWTKNRVAQELALGGPHPKVIGSPTTVVDELQRWVDETGIDGFNLSHAASPGSFEDVIEFVIPEMKKRRRLLGSRPSGRPKNEGELSG